MRRPFAKFASTLGLASLMLTLATACRRGAGDGSILASGHVEATEVKVSTKVPGTIELLAVDEGSKVAIGDEIARIDTTDTRLALDTATAEQAMADAELRLRLAGARIEDIREARAAVTRAEADLLSAERDLERMVGLLASGSGTTKSRDDAQTRHDVAKANLVAAQERLARLEAGSRQEEIEAARARLQAARARVAQLEQQLTDSRILAPTAGVVTEKLAEQGELAAKGGGLVVVTDLDHAWLNAYIAEPDLGSVRLGQDARVRTDAGEERGGRVSYVASRAEFTPKNVQTRDERVKLVYRIKIALDNREGLFKPGMPAEATLSATAARP